MAKRHTYQIGQTYGCQKLIKISKNEDNRLTAIVECIFCKKVTNRRAHYIFSDKYNSCMCRDKRVNGLSNSRIYGIFHNMLDRCNNPNCVAYPLYGAKGVSVCEEWSGDGGFMKFYEWAKQNGYTNNLTIDRIDSNGNYHPNNCQWLTRGENTAKSNVTQHRRANNGEYYGVSPDGKFYRFMNASEFCRQNTELDAGCVRACANGAKRTHHGWRFGFTSQLPCIEPQSTIESVGQPISE